MLFQLFECDGRTLSDLEAPLAMSPLWCDEAPAGPGGSSLVTTRKVGREKLHYLNPVPIQLLYDRWIGKYAAGRLSVLADLKAALEGEERMTTNTDARPRIVNEIMISAPVERVWEALTTSGFTTHYFYGSSLESDLKVGSPFNYRMPDGSLVVEGEVLESDPPRRLSHTITHCGASWLRMRSRV